MRVEEVLVSASDITHIQPLPKTSYVTNLWSCKSIWWCRLWHDH